MPPNTQPLASLDTALHSALELVAQIQLLSESEQIVKAVDLPAVTSLKILAVQSLGAELSRISTILSNAGITASIKEIAGGSIPAINAVDRAGAQQLLRAIELARTTNAVSQEIIQQKLNLTRALHQTLKTAQVDGRSPTFDTISTPANTAHPFNSLPCHARHLGSA